MNLLRNQGQSQRDYIQMGRCWLALVGLGGFLAGAPLHAATIQLDITLAAGTAINASSGSAATGIAYVGSFFNGSTAMNKSSVADLWNGTRASFQSLWSNFVSVATSSVTSGQFSFSAVAEVTNVGGRNLVGKNIYVLVVDSASSPNGFLLLAADGLGSFEVFADPANEFGDNITTLEISGESLTQEVPEFGPVTIPASTTVVGTTGSYNPSNDSWTMVSIPGSSATPTIVGAATAEVFTTTYGTASAVQTFTVSGSNLTADIVATAPTGFEVSSNGVTYAPTASFAPTNGSLSGTLSIRLSVTAPVTGTYNSQSIVLSSTGSTDVNIATTANGNSVTAKALTISGLTATPKDFDGTTSATVTGTPFYVGLANGETFAVSGAVSWAFPDAEVGTSKMLSRSGNYSAPSANYTVTQPVLTADIRALPTLRLLSLGSPVFTNGNTVITHTFAGNSNTTYIIEYKSSLAGIWQTNAVSVSSSPSFSVTFTNSGVNSTNDWKNRMFFRVKNG